MGEQLLDVRRDKRERAAFAATQAGELSSEGEDDAPEIEEGYRIHIDEDEGSGRYEASGR